MIVRMIVIEVIDNKGEQMIKAVKPRFKKPKLFTARNP